MIDSNFNLNSKVYHYPDLSNSSEAEKELLSILAVHPMRRDALEIFLNKSGNDWNLIEDLINANQIKEVYYNDDSFLINSKKSNFKFNISTLEGKMDTTCKRVFITY